MDNYSYSHYTKKRQKQKMRAFLMRVLAFLGGLIAVMILAVSLVKGFGHAAVVIDKSMSPGLVNEDVVLINRLSKAIGSVGRMDVAAIRISNSENSPIYVRRIIGIPGDKVKIEGGSIYVNGEKAEAELFEDPIEDAGVASEELVLDEDSYFVLCDDYNSSRDDSRLDSIGLIEREQIVGKVWLIWSPMSRFGFVD